MELSRDKIKEIINDDWLLMDYCEGNKNCDVVKELARIALASLEAEAVGEVVLGEYDDCGCHPDARVACIAADGQADWENFKDGTRLFTAPPASAVNAEPVSFDALRDAVTEVSGAPAMEWSDIYKGHQAVPFINFNSLARIVDKFRAAMLRGVEPVTTAYKLPANTPCKEAPEYIWLQTAGVWPENGEFSELTWCSDNQHTDDTLYVRADVVADNSQVVPDGLKLVPVEPTAEMLQSGISAHYERSQIQIHDRPAPGPMECAYVAMLAAAPQQEE